MSDDREYYEAYDRYMVQHHELSSERPLRGVDQSESALTRSNITPIAEASCSSVRAGPSAGSNIITLRHSNAGNILNIVKDTPAKKRRSNASNILAIVKYTSVKRRLFLSYRSDDTQQFAGRVDDKLVSAFGRENVFFDIESMPAGDDSRVCIKMALNECGVFFALVGPNWVGRLPRGRSRITERTDPIRTEIATAIKFEIPIVPLLVGDTKMPKVDLLPPSLRKFASIVGVRIGVGRDFHPNLDRILQQIEERYHISGSEGRFPRASDRRFAV
jgi:hypothetical protein